jgi:hypothetical protein
VWLSAAVIMLVASSLLFRYSDRAKAIATGGTPDTTPVVAAATTELQRIEREYGTTADALSEAMKEPRVHQNAPDVAESLARSVAVIDAAIAEAREDLIKDPSSDFARQALVRNYQQKIDLLRRVTARAVSN